MPSPRVVVELFGGEREIQCDCGCGRRHRGFRGKAVRNGGAEEVLFYALTTECDDERYLWLAVGSGPWDSASDPRDCFCSVQIWVADGSVHSRVTDAAKSPWKHEPIFTENVARLIDRDEVMRKQGAPEWLFGWTDALATAGLPQLGRFLLRSE
jgi:hypothetical protein